jgi:hypothetical protein
VNQQTNANLVVLTASEIDDYTGAREEQAAVNALPAVVIEEARRVDDPVTGTPRVVRSVTIKLPSGTALTNDDRLRDADTGTEYAVRSVHSHPTGGWPGDLIADAVRLDNTQP